MNIWDEKNCIGQEKNSSNNKDGGLSDSMTETGSASTTSAWNVTGSLNQVYNLCYDGQTQRYIGDNPSNVVYLWTETRGNIEYPCYVGQTRWNYGVSKCGNLFLALGPRIDRKRKYLGKYKDAKEANEVVQKYMKNVKI